MKDWLLPYRRITVKRKAVIIELPVEDGYDLATMLDVIATEPDFLPRCAKVIAPTVEIANMLHGRIVAEVVTAAAEEAAHLDGLAVDQAEVT
jgi:hypothetical protein